MTEITIQIDDSAVRQLLDRAPTRIDLAMRQALTDATSLLLREAKTYPPPPDPIQGPQRVPVRSFTTRGGVSVRILSRSAHGKGVTWADAKSLRYVRTGTLGKSWHKEITGAGASMVGRVYSDGNTAPYNRYVQDRERQARIHQNRWDTIQQIAERNTDNIQQMFNARIRAALG